MKKNEVRFILQRTHTYNRCRACGNKILLFNLIQNNDEYDDISYAILPQAPSEELKIHCPYCGKKEMWIEDE